MKKFLSLLLSTLLVASTICVTGLISFAGLISPHIARMMLKRQNTATMILSATVGAGVMLISDILARTLVQDTPVLLMDEPDSALDFVNRNVVLRKIRHVIHHRNKAGLITLHDPNFALSYCDTLLLMKEGSIIQRLPVAGASREDVENTLKKIYGNIRILSHEGGFVMVRGMEEPYENL